MLYGSCARQALQRALRFCNFGERFVPYEEALALQNHLVQEVKLANIPDTLLQLQHQPVYTLGKRGKKDDFLKSEEELRKLGVDIHTIARGGETTFHGPGQIIMYPIVNLRRLGIGARAYVEGLEDTIISTLQRHGISAQGRQPHRTGVWVGDEKIAAIGVQISGGVTRHGLAVNFNTDLKYFDYIVPCGLPDFQVTSMSKLDCANDLNEFRKSLRDSFVQQFKYEMIEDIEPQML